MFADPALLSTGLEAAYILAIFSLGSTGHWSGDCPASLISDGGSLAAERLEAVLLIDFSPHLDRVHLAILNFYSLHYCNVAYWTPSLDEMDFAEIC